MKHNESNVMKCNVTQCNVKLSNVMHDELNVDYDYIDLSPLSYILAYMHVTKMLFEKTLKLINEINVDNNRQKDYVQSLFQFVHRAKSASAQLLSIKSETTKYLVSNFVTLRYWALQKYGQPIVQRCSWPSKCSSTEIHTQKKHLAGEDPSST